MQNGTNEKSLNLKTIVFTVYRIRPELYLCRCKISPEMTNFSIAVAAVNFFPTRDDVFSTHVLKRSFRVCLFVCVCLLNFSRQGLRPGYLGKLSVIQRAVAPESSCLRVIGSVSGLGLVFPLGRRLFRHNCFGHHSNCFGYTIATGLVTLVTNISSANKCSLSMKFVKDIQFGSFFINFKSICDRETPHYEYIMQ
eukprot:sb/3470921/